MGVGRGVYLPLGEGSGQGAVPIPRFCLNWFKMGHVLFSFFAFRPLRQWHNKGVRPICHV